MAKRKINWIERSPVSKLAHVLERVGLALTGSACGLFVAAYLVNSNIKLFGTDAAVFAFMALGFAGFYLGIDLPSRAANGPTHRPSGIRFTVLEASEILSAVGTFLAAIEATAAVTFLITGDTFHYGPTLGIGVGWVFGASLQIIAGVLARLPIFSLK